MGAAIPASILLAQSGIQAGGQMAGGLISGLFQYMGIKEQIKLAREANRIQNNQWSTELEASWRRSNRDDARKSLTTLNNLMANNVGLQTALSRHWGRR